MDYEKKYNEALEHARAEILANPGLRKMWEEIFPQLRESEDERMRKLIIDRVRSATEMTEGLRELLLTYLEKQKEQKPNYCHHEVDETGWTEEYRKAYYDGWNNCNMQHEQLKADQKPAEWSEEDQDKINTILGVLHLIGNYNFDSWLKSIRPQPKQEWSKYDNEMFHCICAGLCHLRKLYEKNEDAVSDYNAMLEWFRNCFKFLRPSWKPSEEQVEELWNVISYIEKPGSNFLGVPALLKSLYNQLKRLM